MLNEVAEKRLRAIKEFTEFGSGFKVAMRDLEIRGAGNILGTAQHGHMMNIGYELYCKFVADAVKALQGEVVNDNKEETLVEIPVGAYIPDRYIEDETLRLHMYKKIAEVETEANEEDVIEELIDRFGDVPKQVMNLIKVARIRKLAAEVFSAAWSGAVDCEICGTMERAVGTALHEAARGETLLLSPGTACRAVQRDHEGHRLHRSVNAR